MFDIEQTNVFYNIYDAPFWGNVLFGNTYAEYMTALVVFLMLLVALKLVQFVTLKNLAKLSKRTKTGVDDLLVRIVQTLRPPFYSFIAVYLSVRLFLDLSIVAGKVFDGILVIWVVYQVIFVVQLLIDYFVRRYLLTDEDDPGEESMVHILSIVAKVVLWTIGGLVILSNLGFDVLSILAGLGVLGIAVSLALQPIFTDLFSAFTIYFDKPFRVGDFINVGDKYGTVERIGIKTTRIRALKGDEIVMTNSELTNVTINNIQQLKRRRVAFYFGVTYETGLDRLRNIPNMIEEIVSSLEIVDFSRAHFQKFDDFALSFEVVYFVNSDSYKDYMNAQQEINFGIYGRFKEEGISMAYPTETVYQYNIETGSSD